MPEKRQGFANAIAYYMKLAYNNWHKETVHDDAIQGELTNITSGQLTFTNTPYVRQHRPSDNRDRDGRDRGGYGDYRNKRGGQKFQGRGGRDDRNSGGGRDNRNDRNDRGGKFKKRYK